VNKGATHTNNLKSRTDSKKGSGEKQKYPKQQKQTNKTDQKTKQPQNPNCSSPVGTQKD